MAFPFAYLHLTLTHSKGQGHTHFDCKYLTHDDRLDKHWNCQLIGSRIWLFDWHIYIWPWPILNIKIKVMHIWLWISRKRWQIKQSLNCQNIESHMRPFDWNIYIWPWSIPKGKVKVMHISAVNITQTITDIMLHVSFQSAYLELNLTYSKGQLKVSWCLTKYLGLLVCVGQSAFVRLFLFWADQSQ